ncbi:hypothetical protein BOTBODRAFT_176729 [Botryobasidium botryosum FD-172 SS1]|uniref:Uncharacterized protein n=1 Tax=Botryobasidium botryosum (strain FD-172 SS1) TaxID=930990 RepID=A0A067MKV8_BOTB1|nr:hypothetical protein BOTBODRAFT_176729 [Botryobasidium botryosum FD-172 SS1]
MSAKKPVPKVHTERDQSSTPGEKDSQFRVPKKPQYLDPFAAKKANNRSTDGPAARHHVTPQCAQDREEGSQHAQRLNTTSQSTQHRDATPQLTQNRKGASQNAQHRSTTSQSTKNRGITPQDAQHREAAYQVAQHSKGTSQSTHRRDATPQLANNRRGSSQSTQQRSTTSQSTQDRNTTHQHAQYRDLTPQRTQNYIQYDRRHDAPSQSPSPAQPQVEPEDARPTMGAKAFVGDTEAALKGAQRPSKRFPADRGQMYGYCH